jgi:mannose-6-phosphate isomerase-like protein (cupin superfamily)
MMTGMQRVDAFADWAARQLFYVLAGRLAIELEQETVELLPGDSFEVAPRTIHRVHNPFADDASFLVISSPSTAQDRIDSPR